MIEYELNIIKTGHRVLTPGGLLEKFALSYTFAQSREREFGTKILIPMEFYNAERLSARLFGGFNTKTIVCQIIQKHY